MVMAVLRVMAVLMVMVVPVVMAVLMVMAVPVAMAGIGMVVETQHDCGIDAAALDRKQGSSLTNLRTKTIQNALHSGL